MTKMGDPSEFKGAYHLQVDKVDTQFSEPRVHCPEERSKAKEVENYHHTSVPMGIRLKLFRPIVSVNQLSIYGAVRFV